MTFADVTGSDLLHARQFLDLVASIPGDPQPDIVPIRLKDLLHLLAWYGRIRADGAPPRRLVLGGDKP